MSTQFTGTGNIGTEPTLKTFSNESGDRHVLSMRVFFDNPVKKGDEYEDRGGFWAKVDLWMRTGGEGLQKIYQKGQRVLVCGQRIEIEGWEDKDSGEERYGFKVTARHIGILPVRIESITMKQKSAEAEESEEPPMPGKDTKKSRKAKKVEPDELDEIPF